MAKKKRATGPQKACVGCGKMIHARKGTCDDCGTEQLSSKAANNRKSVKTATKKRKPAKTTGVATELDAVESAADFISSVGGLQEAQQALDVAADLAKRMA